MAVSLREFSAISVEGKRRVLATGAGKADQIAAGAA
jgi:hypothetical protein